MYGVPTQTLRDRVKGKIKIETVKSGPEPMLAYEEEERLVSHVEMMGKIGYGYTNAQLAALAGDLAFTLGKKENGSPMSDRWLYRFMGRWSARLKSVKPRSLESMRASSTTQEVVQNYYAELDRILEKYSLKDRPQYIYNLDETGLQQQHRPQNIIATKEGVKAQSVVSPRSSTTTMIGCVNAMGQALPPFFIFQGKRLVPELMTNASVGAGATMTDSGWSTTEAFTRFMEHFDKNAPKDPEGKVPRLVLYDGHSTHVNLSVIDWAIQHNIVIFVLPPHTSHVLQPLDVSCFGPFKSIYYAECGTWMRTHMGQVITRYEVSGLASKAYDRAMTPANIKSGFRKTGIFPLNENAVPKDVFLPAKEFVRVKEEKKAKTEEIDSFLSKKMEENRQTDDIQRPGKSGKRPALGGKAITEEEIYNDIQNYQEERKKKTPKRKESADLDKKKNNKTSTKKRKGSDNDDDPQPSTSGVSVVKNIELENDEDDDDEPVIAEKDKCCICKSYEPPNLKDLPYVIFVAWGQCDKCAHWCHLKFCCNVKALRRNADFLCPHCN